MTQFRKTALKSLWTIGLVLAAILLWMSGGATRADIILNLVSVTPMGNDFQYTYSASLTSGSQLHAAGGGANTGFSMANNFFTLYDISGLVAGSEVYAGALAANSMPVEQFLGSTPVTSNPVHPDSASLLNLTTYWTGPDVTASGTSSFELGTLTFLSHNPLGPGFLSFTGAGQKLEDVNLLANNTGEVAGPGSAAAPVPEPRTLMLLAMGLPIVGGLYYRWRS
jgi:hypothetical protein